MNRSDQASRCRQQIREHVLQLDQLAQSLMGRAPLIRGSFYAFRRRCGKPHCRCAREQAHQGRALVVRRHGRPVAVSVRDIAPDRLSEHVRTYRELRRGRAEMVRTFTDLLRNVDRLERLGEVAVQELREPGFHLK